MMKILILLSVLTLCASQNVESSWYFPRSAMLRQRTPLLRTLIQASDPLEFLQRTMDEVVVREAKDHSASMAEYYLGRFDMSCVQRSFCEVATASRTTLDKPEEAAQLSMSVIKRMLNDLDEDQKRKKKFKNVQKLVAAYNVGTSTKNVTLCQWLFPCQEKMAEEEEVEGVQTRVKCTQMSKLCPGFSISCAMCGMLMPQACAGVCPFAGLYCGVSGYACKLNKNKSPIPTVSGPMAVLGEEESEVEGRLKAQFRAETLVERKPANEPEPESRSGEGTGEKKMEMFEIQGRKNIEFARQTASEPKPINFETRSGEGTGEKLEMFEIQGRNNVERKTASEAKPIDNGEKDDLRNPKTAEMVEIKEESEEIKTAEMETEIES